MKLLLVSILGESKLDEYVNTKKISQNPSQISPKTWKEIKKWCYPQLRNRPKSLVEVIRILRADMYATSNGANVSQPSQSETDEATKKKIIYISSAIAATTLVITIALSLFSSSENVDEAKVITPVIVKQEPASTSVSQNFEQLPVTLQEPLKIGGVAPTVKKLPPADFLMGDQQGMGDDNEKPAHLVTIPKGFYLSSYEVTFDQYDVFAKSTNRILPLDNGWGRGNRPVINVSWYDAKAYTVWLTEQTGKNYRLPTEIEWEYSIRAKSNLSYWYGDEVKKGYSVCDDCGSEWDGISTAPVGSQISNPFGLFDMHGNVAEWVEDCYHDNYNNAPTENIIWLANSCTQRVIRGGSWFDIPRVGRSSTRYPAKASLKASNWGFRVVRVIPNTL